MRFTALLWPPGCHRGEQGSNPARRRQCPSTEPLFCCLQGCFCLLNLFGRPASLYPLTILSEPLLLVHLDACNQLIVFPHSLFPATVQQPRKSQCFGQNPNSIVSLPFVKSFRGSLYAPSTKPKLPHSTRPGIVCPLPASPASSLPPPHTPPTAQPPLPESYSVLGQPPSSLRAFAQAVPS